MEGLSGQSDPRTFSFGMPQYPQGQALLVADVNAVIEGLYAGGATEVHVVDGHGSGNPAPDVRRDLLDSRAQQIVRDSSFDSYFDLVAPRAYDAVAVVGMHAKTGSGGFASHTYTIGIGFVINGKTITETELVALSWGRQGIPVIFASGDDRLARDLETMPWIEYVTVKRATAADSAEPRPVAEAHADLRQSAERAMQKLRSGGAKAMRVGSPITAQLHAVPPADISVLDSVPGITYADQRVTFIAQDMHEAYRGLQRLVRVASRAYAQILMEEVRSRPQGQDVLTAYSKRLERRWFDVESGRWTRPAPSAPQTGTKDHGFR
jgi:D-amino peptidase